MHTIKIIPNLLFEYQCTSGKFFIFAESNRIETFLPESECLVRMHLKIQGVFTPVGCRAGRRSIWRRYDH